MLGWPKVNGYYHTEWVEEDELSLKLEGLSMDAVYENLVRQIAGEQLQIEVDGESLKESVARDEQKQQLKKRTHTGAFFHVCNNENHSIVAWLLLYNKRSLYPKI